MLPGTVLFLPRVFLLSGILSLAFFVKVEAELKVVGMRLLFLWTPLFFVTIAEILSFFVILAKVFFVLLFVLLLNELRGDILVNLFSRFCGLFPLLLEEELVFRFGVIIEVVADLLMPTSISPNKSRPNENVGISDMSMSTSSSVAAIAKAISAISASQTSDFLNNNKKEKKKKKKKNHFSRVFIIVSMRT